MLVHSVFEICSSYRWMLEERWQDSEGGWCGAEPGIWQSSIFLSLRSLQWFVAPTSWSQWKRSGCCSFRANCRMGRKKVLCHWTARLIMMKCVTSLVVASRWSLVAGVFLGRLIWDGNEQGPRQSGFSYLPLLPIKTRLWTRFCYHVDSRCSRVWSSSPRISHSISVLYQPSRRRQITERAEQRQRVVLVC